MIVFHQGNKQRKDTQSVLDSSVSVVGDTTKENTINDTNSNFEVRKQIFCDSIEEPSQLVNISAVSSSRKPSLSHNDDCENEIILSFSKEKIRKYQHELAAPGFNGKNYVICAPTGSGKTLVAALIIENHFKIKGRKNAKVLFVVKTQQLAHQQKNKLLEYINGIQVIEITGEGESGIYLTLPQVDVVVCTSGKLRSELIGGKMSITDCSLLMLDECHHTIGVDPFAEIMEHYLVDKQKEKIVPHVVGLTASPGAGKGRLPDLHKAISHQYMLCARLDATSGIKTVQKNTAELMDIVRIPSHELRVLSRRNPTEEFIVILSNAMRYLERMIGLEVPGPFDKNSGAYLNWVDSERETAVLSGNPNQRDVISVIDYLKQYVLARMTYEDFEKENALDVLSQVPIYSEGTSDATQTERELEEKHAQVFKMLSELPTQRNQLLLETEQLLLDHFKSKPKSRGIFFVRSIVHTKYITQWINSSHKLKEVIRPSPITGHSQKGFTKEEQIRVIEGFRNGQFNLLASTSVLEEGLDVPDCDLVIRFQLLSNEIAAVQAQGRARACDSMIHTVIQSQSAMNYNHLINTSKQEFALQALQYLSASNINKDDILELQRIVLFRREERLKADRERTKAWNAKDVMLHCQKCNAQTCQATDVYKYGTDISQPHYIIPSKKIFQEKMKSKPRQRPATGPQFDLQRLFKIACIKCGEELGVWGRWKNGLQYPILKCTGFKFWNITTGAVELCRQWKRVPFEIQFFDYCEAPEVDD